MSLVRYRVLRVIVLVSFRRFVLLNIWTVCFPFYFIIDHEIRKITNVLLIICAKYQPWICVGIMEEVVEIERNTMIVQTGFMLKVYAIVNVTRLNVVYLVSTIIRYFSIAFIANMFYLQIVMFFLITNFLLLKIHFYFQTILIGSNLHNTATISDACTRHMLVTYFVTIWAEQIISKYNVYILSVQNVKKFLFY